MWKCYGPSVGTVLNHDQYEHITLYSESIKGNIPCFIGGMNSTLCFSNFVQLETTENSSNVNVKYICNLGHQISVISCVG